MTRNVLVAVVAMFVFLVAAGVIVLQSWALSNRTEQVWQVTKALTAGDELTADNVRQTTFPSNGDSLDYYRDDPVKAHARAAHDIAPNSVLYRLDVQTRNMALVTLTLKSAPPLTRGQPVDIYVQVGNGSQLTGRGLTVEQATGGTASVWVPAQDEPYWVTLQLTNATMTATRSSGIGVPQGRVQSVQDALQALGGGGAGTGVTQPQPSPTPKKP
jgi:hypothetical protein